MHSNDFSIDVSNNDGIIIVGLWDEENLMREVYIYTEEQRHKLFQTFENVAASLDNMTGFFDA